jgi:hypothetical protein
MIVMDTGRVGFKSHHGLYLSAQPNGTLQCNRGALLTWETFEIVPVRGGSAFKTRHGHYLCVTPEGRCEARTHQDWQTFKVQYK